MRVASWNVNGLRARLEFLREWLHERKPDVVGLQELKMEDALFPHDAFQELGYHALVHGQKSWNGVAVLSREPAELVQRGLPGQAELGARLITVRVGGLEFTSVYCPNGKDTQHADFPRKLGFFDALAGHLGAGGAARLVVGDFNVCPTGLDTWDEAGHAGALFHTDEERARLQRLADLGLHDLFRALHPDAREFSWWDYRGGAFHRGHGLRIDLLLGSADVLARAREAGIDREWRKKQGDLTPSDHAPVVAELA